MRCLNAEILSARIEARADDDIRSGRVGGIALAVRQNGKVVYENCFGSASMTEQKSIKNNTVFRIASMTKPITAVATLILAENRLISLEDPLEKYFPIFKELPLVTLERDRPVKCGRVEKKANDP